LKDGGDDITLTPSEKESGVSPVKKALSGFKLQLYESGTESGTGTMGDDDVSIGNSSIATRESVSSSMAKNLVGDYIDKGSPTREKEKEVLEEREKMTAMLEDDKKKNAIEEVELKEKAKLLKEQKMRAAAIEKAEKERLQKIIDEEEAKLKEMEEKKKADEEEAEAKAERKRLEEEEKAKVKFIRSEGQPPDGDVVGWEVDVEIAFEEEDVERGDIVTEKQWFSGFVTEWHPYNADGTVRDELSVRLYNNEKNEILFEIDDDFDEDSHGKKRALDDDDGDKAIVEVVKAGGEGVKYKVKRPVGAQTYSDGGGWEVRARMEFDVDDDGVGSSVVGSEKKEYDWARGMVCGYNPSDDVIMVKFYNDGKCEQMFNDMYEEDSKAGGSGKFSEHSFFLSFDAVGANIEYLCPRPVENTQECVGWWIKAFVVTGIVKDDDDDSGSEEDGEEEYDWVFGRLKAIAPSKDDEEDMVYVVKVVDEEKTNEYECNTDMPLEVQFIEPPKKE